MRVPPATHTIGRLADRSTGRRHRMYIGAGALVIILIVILLIVLL